MYFYIVKLIVGAIKRTAAIARPNYNLSKVVLVALNTRAAYFCFVIL